MISSKVLLKRCLITVYTVSQPLKCTTTWACVSYCVCCVTDLTQTCSLDSGVNCRRNMCGHPGVVEKVYPGKCLPKTLLHMRITAAQPPKHLTKFSCHNISVLPVYVWTYYRYYCCSVACEVR